MTKKERYEEIINNLEATIQNTRWEWRGKQMSNKDTKTIEKLTKLLKQRKQEYNEL